MSLTVRKPFSFGSVMGLVATLALLIATCRAGAYIGQQGDESDHDEQVISLPQQQAATVSQTLAYSSQEQAVLDEAEDETGWLDSQALHVLLRRAGMLPIGQETLDRADRVRPANLLEFPERYRGRLVLLDVRIWRVARWEANLSQTQWWPQRPTWRLDCTVAAEDEQGGMPIILFITEPPMDFAEGELPHGPGAQTAALFCQTVRLAKHRIISGEEPTRLYPVLTTNALYPAGQAATVDWPLAVLFGLLVLLLIGFMFAKQYARRRTSCRRHRPARTSSASLEEGDAVDTELQQQLEEYQRRQEESQS